MPTGKKEKHVLITGGAGFIGTNLAHRLLNQGKHVLVFDDLSRPGVEQNLNWLCRKHGDRVVVEVADIADLNALEKPIAGAEAIYHLAAQVAVTTSVENPRLDFDVNVRGTFNVLETVRRQTEPPPVLFTSTNKVYGKLGDLKLVKSGRHYEPDDERIRNNGVGEEFPLDFRSPYGCSKGAADQYVLDYGRIYRLPTTVFRMSCIYGPHQFGTEDQGWVAHFLIRAITGESIILYGDGFQVRDVLFIDDLVDALLAARNHIADVAGKAFNIGGGCENIISLVELIETIGHLNGKIPDFRFSDWRTEDQKYYVSNISRFRHITGWRPKTDTGAGIRKLWEWLSDSLIPSSVEKTKSGRTVA